LDVFKTAPSEKLLQLIMGPDWWSWHGIVCLATKCDLFCKLKMLLSLILHSRQCTMCTNLGRCIASVARCMYIGSTCTMYVQSVLLHSLLLTLGLQ
jgi:hypothetical protein